MHDNRTLPAPVGVQNLAIIRAKRHQALLVHGYTSYADYLGEVAWRRNARVRHVGAQDPREAARRLKRQGRM